MEWFDGEAVVLIDGGWLFAGPGCTCPSSPGAKVRHEQNPSDDVIRSVLPSFDLFQLSASVFKLCEELIPGKICESCKVEIADDTQRLLLLRVVDVHSILGSDSVYHAVG